MIWKIVIGAVLCLVAAVSAILIVGRWLWRKKSEKLLTELSATTRHSSIADLEVLDVQRLPDPVQRYLSLALVAQQKWVESVRISHSGTFNTGTVEPKWCRFSSTQHVMAGGPGFVWNGHIRMAPGMTIRVHDAYVKGRAVLTARLFGLIKVMESPNSTQLAEGELIRFLAEAPWYPTALLASPALNWVPINDASARVSLVDRGLCVSLLVRFGKDGLIESVYSEGRFRDVDGTQVRTPWEGRFWNWEQRDGMLIPLDGEVAWLLPEGRWPYWRGHIDDIAYKLVE